MKHNLYSDLGLALAGHGPLEVRRFSNKNFPPDGRWFVVKDGGILRFTVEVGDRRPGPCFVNVHAPVRPSPACTAESAPGGWWIRQFTAGPCPRGTALCAVAAGFLMVGVSASGEWTCRLTGAEVEGLVRRREREVAALLPREAYDLVSKIERCVREVEGLDVAEAMVRVRKDAELLADRMGEDEWLTVFREATVRKVHSA